jgi:hypothetical protein
VIRLVPNPDAPLLVLLVMVAYVVSAAITTQETVALADQTPTARTWLANARNSLAEHPHVAALDSLLPPEALPAALFPEGAKASNALAPIAEGIRWNQPAERMFIFDPTGTLRPGVVREATRQAATEGCVIALAGGVDDVAMDPALVPWVWGVHLAYTADAPSAGAVRIGDAPPQVVHFEEGEHELVLVHNGPVSSVTVHASDGRVCVTEVHAGRVVPAPPAS